MKDKIIIFGAGIWGKVAYEYYKDRCEILCYVDNNSELWGQFIHGIEICSPSVLEEYIKDSFKVVIANKRRRKSIQKQLHKQFGIKRTLVFQIVENAETYGEYIDKGLKHSEIIVKYQGGLGNQMFQYAFARCFMNKGYRVTADISDYYLLGRRPFMLEKVFPQIEICDCDEELLDEYKKSMNIEEDNINSVDILEPNMDVLSLDKGYFDGYWQFNYYAELVRNELDKDFVFSTKSDEGLMKVICQIQSQNAISVHIRRGDYLTQEVQKSFGNICSNKYYENAISIMHAKIENPTFYFFSDDIEWVKKNMQIENAIYIQEDMFDSYEDWYDLKLISLCKHNIICNSSFSWWGAWLNKNPNKLVIAPKKWTNICDIRGICPKTWLTV